MLRRETRCGVPPAEHSRRSAAAHAGLLRETAPLSPCGKRPTTSTSLASVRSSRYAAFGPPGRQPFLMASSWPPRFTESVVLGTSTGAVSHDWFAGGTVGGYVLTTTFASICVVPETLNTCVPGLRSRAKTGGVVPERQRSSSVQF